MSESVSTPLVCCDARSIRFRLMMGEIYLSLRRKSLQRSASPRRCIAFHKKYFHKWCSVLSGKFRKNKWRHQEGWSQWVVVPRAKVVNLKLNLTLLSAKFTCYVVLSLLYNFTLQSKHVSLVLVDYCCKYKKHILQKIKMNELRQELSRR